MTLINAYSTAEQFISRYLPSQTVAATSDLYTQIEQHIQATSRLIDDYTGRSFFTATADSDRYFTAAARCRCYLDDYQSITTVAIDEDIDGTYALTVATADYWLCPAQPSSGWPYTYIEIVPWANEHFPVGQPRGVKVTALWGWAAVPDAVREACLLQAFRIYKRQAAPFGVIGGGDLGTATVIPGDAVMGLDRDVAMMLRPYTRIAP